MATLVLQVAGAAVGGLIGGPVGAIAGRALGGIAGAVIDTSLLSQGGGGTQYKEGPRLADLDGLTSTEGAPVPHVYGRARIGGQLIWATRFEEVPEHTINRTPSQGGKGGGSRKTVTTTYSYYANIAIGLCEGPIAYIRRVWADGKELDPSISFRTYIGDEEQQPDHLIVSKEGLEHAPAYRGLAYVVFERLPLADFGNRIPQFTFEVVRPVNGLGERIQAIELIPGASEFAYEPATVVKVPEAGVSEPENRHQQLRESDVMASLDALAAVCPNLKRVALVASWFGTDMRAGECRIEPRVDDAFKVTHGGEWAVAGLMRGTASEVSRVDGAPAYGGTPSDASVIALIREMKDRGWQVMLYPFVMMDVPAENDLPNPWDGTPRQPPYPWRGRVTCSPAPGQPGSPDGTSAAAAQVARFFGSVSDWGLRRLVLHYAWLAVEAGGVESFVIGSELVGLTRVRSGAGVYPAVQQLVALAAEVRAILGAGTKITYAADWTEYGTHVRDGGQEVRFPLDPLWASPNIDAVGIDYYAPLSDWRDGTSHLDAREYPSVYDPAYLASRVTAGEGFDWYYADKAGRDAQQRLPITDGDYGKPWMYRQKDLAGWWSQPHIERMNGVEIGATPWQPYGKHIWLTEIGIPAVDRGTNGPNVFPDPKSSESAVPPFSRGGRDDLIQNRGLKALIGAYDDGETEANPASPIDGRPMVEPGHTFVWTWDARPYPAFPSLSDVWRDGGNWETGHWLTGRLDGLSLDAVVEAIIADWGLESADVVLEGELDGYVIDRPMSARQALEPLANAYAFHAVASAGQVRFRNNGGPPVLVLAEGDVVPDREGAGITLRRAQETDLASEIRLGFTDGERDYRRASAVSRRLAGGSRRSMGLDLAAVLRPELAQHLADIGLQAQWMARESASFALSPRVAMLEPGDIVELPVAGGMRPFAISRVVDGETRQIEAHAVEPSLQRGAVPVLSRTSASVPQLPGPPLVQVIDVPLAYGDTPPLQAMAVFADPWPAGMAIWRSVDGAAFSLYDVATMPAIVGETLTPLGPGPLWRWDRGNSFDVRFRGGMLTAIDDIDAFAGNNTLAVLGENGRWEALTIAHAELVAPGVARLSRLLRGLGGTEAEASRSVPAGSRVIVLDNALVPLATSLDDLGKEWVWRVAPANSDHADIMAVELRAAVSNEVLRPRAPVHLAARRLAGGIAITFIRQTRRGGDNWELDEVPLSEEREAYEVDILDAGGALLRRLAVGSPSVLYSSADELADFGVPQTSLRVAVVQVSASVGRGFAVSAALPIF